MKTLPRVARRGAALLLVVLAAGACGTASTGSISGSNASVLTAETLANYQGQTAFEVVRQLRASWLNARRGGSLDNIGGDGTGIAAQNMRNEIQVYIDGARQELGVDVLRTISIDDVQELRHLNGVDANMRFGADHGSGAILVTTKGD